MHALTRSPSLVDSLAPWEHRLRLLLDSTDEGVFGIDLDGNCMFINQAAARMIGLPADEALGRNMHALTHHSHADGAPYPETHCPIFNAFREAMPCRLDNEVFWRSDGSSFAASARMSATGDDATTRAASRIRLPTRCAITSAASTPSMERSTTPASAGSTR